jgi:hypothetical protein
LQRIGEERRSPPGELVVGIKNEMTIRDRLNRQVRWVYPLLFLAVGLFVLGGIPVANRVLGFPWPMLPAAAILFVVFYYMIFGIKCPGCGQSLLGSTWSVGGKPFSVGKRMRFCPRCGVDFDSGWRGERQADADSGKQ